MPIPVTPLALSLQDRAFLTSEAHRLGITPGVLKSARFTRVSQGIRSTGDPDLAARVLAVLRALPPGTAVSGCTGLHLWGVPVGPAEPLVFVTSHPHPVRRAGVRVIRRTGPASTSRREPAAACFAAAELDLLHLVIAGDQLINLRLATPETLAAAVVRGRRGAKRARRAAELVRVGSESPKETEVRLLATLAGLPEPACNAEVYDGPTWLARGDLVWAAYRVIVEYDGLQHLTDREQWERDVLRLEGLADAGWTVIRVTARRLRNPHALLDDLARALRRGGWDGQVVPSSEWTQIFGR